MSSPKVRATLDAVFAAESARIVSSIVRVTGDWQLAEDCLQDASARALNSWAADGIPANPGAWLTTVARNRAVDQIRHFAAERRAVERVAREVVLTEAEGEPTMFDDAGLDDRLSLIFTCCHPALSMDARVALTLRVIAGMSVESIARSFLVSEPTMTKRLVRARAKIKDAGIPYRVPPRHLLHERTAGVLAVLYLLFNSGYSSSQPSGLIDTELEAEAIRLTRLLVALIDEQMDNTESRSLLALMLLNSSRDLARVDQNGRLIRLDAQDRSLWDHDRIREAVDILNEVTALLEGRRSPGGRYYLQASIAAQHAIAESDDATNFVEIARLYQQLAIVMPSPVVELNRAAAIAMADGPDVGLRLIEALDATGALDNYYLLPAARADLLHRLGRDSESLSQYQRAAALAPTVAEREYLEARIVELS